MADAESKDGDEDNIAPVQIDDGIIHSRSVEPLVNVLSCGWTEDGRLGYASKGSNYQIDPRPISALRKEWGDPKKYRGQNFKQFVVEAACAGDRQTLFLMINCREETMPAKLLGVFDKDFKYRSRKILICGLNQLGLCEEVGNQEPKEVHLESEDIPTQIACGGGTCFIITHFGDVYSFGQGNFGVLGHCDRDIPMQVPRQISSLNGIKVTSVAAGAYHAICLAHAGRAYSWGKNSDGQLGLGFTSECELSPRQIPFFQGNNKCVQISCGMNHCLALVDKPRASGESGLSVFAWGNGDRGQLGSGDLRTNHTPQENRWVSRYCKKFGYAILDVCAGGFHNLARTDTGNYVISWGGGDYGQLGRDFAWDDSRPAAILDLSHVIQISAGRRHSMCICLHNGVKKIYSWGYNAYGELGIGDMDIRLKPTLVTAIDRGDPVSVSCGTRHSIICLSHRPKEAQNETVLKPYFDIIKGGVSSIVTKLLKADVKRKGIDPSFLDDPKAILPGQIGSGDDTIYNQTFEPGIRYCLDTFVDPDDWRRKGIETAYACQPLGMKAICLACARFCQKSRRLQPFVRYRSSTSKCECARTKWCKCSWSSIRNEIDKNASHDGTIGPNNVRDILQVLRGPAPIDSAELDECMMAIADGATEEDTEPRMNALVFERWYRTFYQISSLEIEIGSPSGKVTRIILKEEEAAES
jgi:alpha-tubulin suppressor-like RCC1 family protein